MLLDLRVPLVRVIKGTVEGKREYKTTNQDGGGSHNYYCKLDSLKHEFEIDYTQYAGIEQGDTVEIRYHKRSFLVEDVGKVGP